METTSFILPGAGFPAKDNACINRVNTCTIPLSMSPSASSRLVALWPALRVETAGLFISSGEGRHAARKLRSFELILVRSGHLRLHEGKETLSAKQGEMLILHPGLWHRGVERYPAGLAFYWLHFRLPARLAAPLKLPHHAIPVRPLRMVELFQWFLDDQQNGLLSEARARSLVLLLLEELLQPPPLPGGDTASWLTTSIEESIAEDFTRQPRLGGLAKKLGYSADYLDRVFKKAKGKTIPQFIRERRIEEARSLLIESNLLLKEIAQRCGYANAAHFTRSFQAATGLAPQQFRALYPNKHINLH